MGLLDDLAQQGLITGNEEAVGNGLLRATNRVTTRHIPATTDTYTDSAHLQANASRDYLGSQIQKQRELENQTGLLSYNNLTDNNPLVSVPANVANFGVRVAGSVLDQVANLAGGINVSNANAEYSAIPDDIKDIYQREKLDSQRVDNNAALTGIQNALAAGQESSLIGYDKRFKTRTELDDYLKDLTNKVNAKPVTQAERARLDNPDGRAMITNSLLSPLRQSYRDVFNQIEQNYEDDRMWRGNRDKNVDNIFGSRSWGNDYAIKQLIEDFQRLDKANADLNKQGQFQRANTHFGSSDYWDGASKSLSAYTGSVGAAAQSLRDNPMALTDVAAETVPFLISRIAKLAFAGDANRIIADGSQAIADRKGQPAIDGLDAIGNAAAAAAYTGLNLVEREILLGAASGRAVGASTLDRIGEATKSAASRITTKVADALPASVVATGRVANAVAPTSLLRNAATAGALEGAVETAQTQFEDSWSKGKTDVDTSNLAQAGVLGAAMGAAFSAPGSVIESVSNVIGNRATAQAEQQYGNVESPIDDLVNPANPDYAPAKAINRILTQELPNQNYDGAKEQIDGIISNINNQLNGLEKRAAYFDNPDALKQRIDAGNNVLDNFKQSNSPDTNPNYDLIVDNYTNQIGSLQSMYDEITSPDFDSSVELNTIDKLKQSLLDIEEPYKTFNDAYTRFKEPATDNSDVGVTDAEPTAKASEETTTTEDEARKHLGAPTASNLTRINQLANDQTVSEPVRNNLRVVADALLQANSNKTPETVRKQVTKGDTGFRGTEQYIDEMSKAMNAGDTARQESLVRQLNIFAETRQSKLDALQQAQQIADDTKRQIQVVKQDRGGWIAVEGKALPRSQFEKNNGLLVNPHRADGTKGADTLIAAVQDELSLIQSTHNALQAMRSIPADTFNGQVNDLRDNYMTDRNTFQVNLDPMQAALDDFNQAQRDANAWNENSRSSLNPEDTANEFNTDNADTEQTRFGSDVSTSTEDPTTIQNGSVQTTPDGTGTVEESTVNETGLPKQSMDEIISNEDSSTVPTESIQTSEASKGNKPIDQTRTKQTKQSEVEPPKDVSKPERFNYRKKFKDSAEATKYISKYKKENIYYVSTNDKGETVIVKNPPADKQPKVNSDVSVQVANDQDTLTSQVAEQTDTEQSLSEMATEATQVQPTILDDSIVGYEDNTVQESTTDSSPEGAIAPLATDGKSTKEFIESERSKPWRLQNLISSGFIQRIRDGFNSPLANVPNYVGTLNEGNKKQISDSILEHTGEEASIEQINLVDDFLKFNKSMGVQKYLRTAIRANKSPEYNYKYFADFLLNDKGELDENTSTAIALSMYSWVGENASSLYADKRAMGKILGIKNVDDIPPAVVDRISTIGTHQKTLAATLGQRAYQALQMKMLKDADPSRQSKVEQMLGTIAIGAMIDLGLAERTRMRNGELYAMAQYAEGNIDDVNPKLWNKKPSKSVDIDRINNQSAVYFIRPATKVNNQGQLVPTNYNKRVQDIHKNTKGILPKIFGFEPYTSLPSLEPIKTIPATFNELGGELPKMVKDALIKQQSVSYHLNMPMIDVLNTLSSTPRGNAAIERILGFVDPNERHPAFKKTILSVNLGIQRSLRLLGDTVNLVEDKPFYLASTVWSNYRNGNVAGFNPQGDKIHRGFVSLTNDLITVPTERTLFNDKGELTQYGMFLRGLAFRMEDVKINGNAVDKTLVEEFIPQFADYIDGTEVTNAANSLNNISQGNYTNSDIDAVSDLLTKWEMGSLGLSALMAINDRNQAIAQGKESFDVRMSADSDGLVNGPSITNIMLNSGTPEFNRSVGIIPFANEGEVQITSMQQLRKDPNAKDPYEQLAEVQKYYWNQLPRDNSPAGFAVRALDYLDNAFGERSGAKRALTPFNYGSSFDSVNRANARGTLNAVYESIEKAILGQNADTNNVPHVTAAVNKLISFYNSSSNSRVPMATIEQIGNGQLLTSSQEMAIKQTDIRLRGGVTTQALISLMSDYIKLRNGKTSLANTLFEAYNAVYQSKLQQAINSKIKNGEAFVAGEDVVETLSAEERQQLIRDSYEYMPVLATPEGIKSKSGNRSGIPLINVGKQWNSDNTIEVRFNSGFGHLLTDESSALSSGKADKKNDVTTLKTDIREKVFETPGVGSLALFIQSHDAFVTYSVMQAMEAQNFHDANSTNAYDLVKMAQVQNKAFLEAVSISHIGKAFVDATITGLGSFKDNLHNMDIVTAANVLTSLRSTLDKNQADQSSSFSEGLEMMVNSYYQGDIDKLTMLSQQYAISQYATEGGSHIITDADRKDLLAKRDELIKERIDAVKQVKAIGVELDTAMHDLASRTNNSIPTTDAVIAEMVEEQSKPVDTFKSELLANKDKFRDPVNLINHVQKNLSKYLNQQGKTGKYATIYNELLNIAKQVLPDNLQVNIIDGSTDVNSILDYNEAVADGTTAWYSSDKGISQINLRTDGDKLNSSVIVHEFLHAATANAIRIVRSNPQNYSEAQQTLNRLDDLYDLVKSKVTAADDAVIHYGVTNLDEFIATGLTNPKFMDYLDNIVDVPKGNRSIGRIATAFRGLVSNVLDIMYKVAGINRSPNIKTISAYEALLLDTAEFVSNTSNVSDVKVNKLGAPKQQAINTVSEYTAKQVYDALDDGKLDPKFQKQLGEVITNVTDKLFSALPHKYARTSQQYTPDVLWNNALQNNRTPYTTGALKAGFGLSAQEQFAVEALEVAMKEATKNGSVSTAYRSIAKAFDEAKATLEPKDFYSGNWNDASEADKQIAQSKYDYIFKVGQNDYITRFTAMALGSQEVNRLLTMKLNHDLFAERGKPAFDKLVNMANKFVNSTTERMTRTLGSTTVQGKLPMLAQIVVEIDLKNRNKAVNLIEDTLTKSENFANEAVNTIKDKANSALLNSPLSIMNNKYANIVTNTLKATKGGRSAISIFDEVRNFRNYDNPNQRLGFLGELANEIGDQNKDQLVGEKLLAYAKQNEGTAQRIRSVVKEDVLSHFADNGVNLTTEQRNAITTSLLRTDVQSLLDTHGYQKIGQLISSRATLNDEIRKYEKRIDDPVKLSRTKSLAWYMVSGIGNQTLAKNPTIIAQNGGLGAGLFSATDEHIKDVDVLASLYAIKYTDKKQLDTAFEIMQSEMKREDQGGTYALVKYHESLAKESYDTLFGRNVVSYIKGYMPNIMNPHKEVVVVSNSADKARLEAAMYVKMGTVNKSDIDPSHDTEAVMYYSEDAGNQRYVSGAMALYNYGRRGSEIDMTPFELVDATNAARSSINTDPNYDPRKDTKAEAIPTYDTEGNVIAYNYEMSNHVRDTYLERNNNFADIIGEYTAAGFNKVNQADQNKAVVDALIEQYKTGYSKDPMGYVYVGAGVNDSTLSQSWAMIPKEIRDYIYQRTGQNGIYVHNQAYLTIFGTKKFSVTGSFDKTLADQHITEKLFTGFMKAVFRNNARVRTAQGERMWQEAVKLLKDIVVIRNVSTALINIISNSFLLSAHGVPPSDIVKHTIEAVKAGGEYRKASAELIKLQNRQRIEVGNADEIQQRINMLQQRIDKNPLIDVIRGGMFSGIVEDIDPDNESYTFASGLERKYEGVINKVPKTVRNVAKHAFVQPGTPMYQFLHSATQYGDFAAKYAMYKYYTEKAPKLLSHDQAIAKAGNNFINYDVPTSQGMQYANDMGLLMFTKYNLRIQRALFELLAKRPASVIGQAIILGALTRLPAGIDPLVFNQIGNPLRNGPLGLLGALDEPFPIQILDKLF